MSALTADNFQLGVVHAVLFTKPDAFSVAGVMRSFFQSMPIFDGDPQTIPDDALCLPPEVPRVVLRAKSGLWRCQIAPARIDIVWNRVEGGPADHLPAILTEAARMIRVYRQKMQITAMRAAAIVTRYGAKKDPGIFLAHHFCHDRWHEAPLNRPESFELHSHKSTT